MYCSGHAFRAYITIIGQSCNQCPGKVGLRSVEAFTLLHQFEDVEKGTMLRNTAIILLALTNVATAFTPSVSVTCAVGPSYTVTLSSGSTTGVIFIDGQCEAQSTAASGTYTFDAASCTTGTVPALGTAFKLVVQEYSNINLASDHIVKITCNLDTSSVTQSINVAATGEDYDVTDATPTVSPTFSVAIEDNTGTAITSGAVGTSVQIVLSIPSNEASVFDFQVTTMSVTADTYSVDIISAGCTQFSSILTQPSAPITGSLTLGFDLFIPKNALTSPNLPGTSSTTVLYEFTIEVCDTACTAPTCGARRRRSINSGNSTIEEIEVAASLVVYPPGHKSATANVILEEQGEDRDVCMSKSPLLGVLVALSVTLAVCVAITAWMFCRLRQPARKDTMSTFSNKGYSS